MENLGRRHFIRVGGLNLLGIGLSQFLELQSRILAAECRLRARTVSSPDADGLARLHARIFVAADGHDVHNVARSTDDLLRRDVRVTACRSDWDRVCAGRLRADGRTGRETENYDGYDKARDAGLRRYALGESIHRRS